MASNKVVYGIDTSGKNRRSKEEQQREAEEFREWQDLYYELDWKEGQELLFNKMWPYCFDAVRCCLSKFTRGNGSQDEYIEAATYGADEICRRFVKAKKRGKTYKKDYPLAMCWWEAKNMVLSRRFFNEIVYDKINLEDLRDLYRV